MPVGVCLLFGCRQPVAVFSGWGTGQHRVPANSGRFVESAGEARGGESKSMSCWPGVRLLITWLFSHETHSVIQRPARYLGPLADHWPTHKEHKDAVAVAVPQSELRAGGENA